MVAAPPCHAIHLSEEMRCYRARAKKLGANRKKPALAILRETVSRAVTRLPVEGARDGPFSVPWHSASITADLDKMDLDDCFDPKPRVVPLELSYDFLVEPAFPEQFTRFAEDTENEGRGQGQIPPSFTLSRHEYRMKYLHAVAENRNVAFIDFTPFIDIGEPIDAISTSGVTEDQLWIAYQAHLARKHVREHYRLKLSGKLYTRVEFGRLLANAKGTAVPRRRARLSTAGSDEHTPRTVLFHLAGGTTTVGPGSIRLLTVSTGARAPAAPSDAEMNVFGGRSRAVSDWGADPAVLIRRCFTRFSRFVDDADRVRAVETDHGVALAQFAETVALEIIVTDSDGTIVSRGRADHVMALGTVFPQPGLYSDEAGVRRFVADRVERHGVRRTAQTLGLEPSVVAQFKGNDHSFVTIGDNDAAKRTLRTRTSVPGPLVPAAAANRERDAATVRQLLKEDRLPIVSPTTARVFGRIQLGTSMPLKPRTKGFGSTPPAERGLWLVPHLGGKAVNVGWSFSKALRDQSFLQKRGNGRDLTKLPVGDIISRLEAIPDRFSSATARATAFEDTATLVAETRALLSKVYRNGKRLGKQRFAAIRLIQRSMKATDVHAVHDQTSCGPQSLRSYGAHRIFSRAVLAEARALGGGSRSKVRLPPPDMSRPFGFSYVEAKGAEEWQKQLDEPVKILVDGEVVQDGHAAPAGSRERQTIGYVGFILEQAARASRDLAVLGGDRSVRPADAVDREEREMLIRRINGTVDMLCAALPSPAFSLLARRFSLQSVSYE
jgi:hypothetical protein